MSIRAKLPLILVLPVLIPLGISVYYSLSALRESLNVEFGLEDKVYDVVRRMGGTAR